MAAKEAKARIKINKLLEESGWRFFDGPEGKANIALELNTKITTKQIDDFGEDFEATKNGFLDFLLLDSNGFPLVVLEAKSEDKHPLVGKEQARTYAQSLNCRCCILSNGNLHYLWDLEHGNPQVISKFPDADHFKSFNQFKPDPKRLAEEEVGGDYIVKTQLPNYEKDASWLNKDERDQFKKRNNLRFLREYQMRAIWALQKAVKEGNTRFLFEMATGTGKTLTAAAVIRLFLKTGNARRVLFLVDRLELEDQAFRNFDAYLKNDFTTHIYKQNRDGWSSAHIIVTTVQSLLVDNKFRRLFSPTDFDLVISDEAHRSIGGNARAVFEYFIGYKLGLTATPRDYLKNFDPDQPSSNDPREAEKRLLLDTYRTFGCDSGNPTFRYSLLDGVKDGYLINPFVVDARTEITTQLLSDKGYAIPVPVEEDVSEDETYIAKDFERKFFSEPTNRTFCQAFLEGALRDPATGEIGKSIVFAVSQKHAAKIAQILNEIAHQMFPGRYQSDFAVQVTSQVPGAQQMTINFSNESNSLLGRGNFDPEYKTSKARVCVTVGMMTTGYDCTDLLNIVLMRPVFSPSDFVQIKGRGTRKHDFREQMVEARRDEILNHAKERFKFFDFFATCEYFEEKFNYDEVMNLPKPGQKREQESIDPPPPLPGGYENFQADAIQVVREHQVGYEGMKIDRMFFEKFEDTIKADATLQKQVDEENWDAAIAYVTQNIFNKPKEFFDLDRLRKAAGVDRRLTLRELLEKAFGLITRFKSKDELLEEEFEKLILDQKPDDARSIQALKYFFKAYLTDEGVRHIIESKDFAQLNVNSTFTIKDFRAVPEEWRKKIPEYIKDYVSINRFM